MDQRTTLQELKVLIQSTQPVIGIESNEEERVRDLVHRAAQELSVPFIDWTVTRGLRSQNQGQISSTEDPMVCLQWIKDFEGDGVFLLKDFVQHLDRPNLVRQFREAAQRVAKRGSSIVVVAPAIRLPAELSHKICFVNWPLPSREELKVLVQSVFDELTRDGVKVRFDLGRDEGSSLLNALVGMTWKQAREALIYSFMLDGSLDKLDIDRILNRKAKSLRDGVMLDYFAPGSLPSEIGGFGSLKAFSARALKSFSKEAKQIGLPAAKGVLLVGVPGCGKSMAAKAIAAAWAMPLLKLDAGRLFDKFIGESEKNFGRAVQAAEAMAPCVFWIDEIEKAMSVANGSGSDGGLSKRLFGAFLTWLQEKKSSVFVVATANDLSSLPPELLRKGRFDEIFFVDLPTLEERVEILRIHLSKYTKNIQDIELEKVAKLADQFSGAELEQVVVAAALSALQNKTTLGTDGLVTEVGRTIPLARSRQHEISELREVAGRQFVSVR